jgi:predicted Zn-dependent peptidase
MINRTLTPELNEIDQIDFIKPSIFDISSSVKLYSMCEVPNQTSRLDLYFNAGTILGDIGTASFVNSLLLSGTNTKTSIEINNEMDSLGAFFESSVSNENALVSIYALKENMLAVLSILKDAIENVAFLEHEVIELVNDRKQKFRIGMEKVSYLAQRSFQQKLFNHPIYGRIAEESDFENVSISTLKRFHKDNYLHGLTKVVLIGAFSTDEIDEVIDMTGNWAMDALPNFDEKCQNEPSKTHVNKEQAVQTAIRVGRMLFNKKDPDFIDFQILNTILGDYFGSRLMTNIREDKGYTYGIGTMVAELTEMGYFLVATEVGSDKKDATLHEIQFEFNRLQTELVSEDELQLVKNYMLGQLLKSADGPYAMMDLFLHVEPFNIGLEYYNQCIESINKITPERIKELAIKYLNWDKMTIVTAG